MYIGVKISVLNFGPGGPPSPSVFSYEARPAQKISSMGRAEPGWARPGRAGLGQAGPGRVTGPGDPFRGLVLTYTVKNQSVLNYKFSAII